MDSMPVVTLDSGLTIGNFSSPHPFKFNTGEILDACSKERSLELSMDTTEEEIFNPGGWIDMALKFTLTPSVLEEMRNVTDQADVILIPFPMLDAMKREGTPIMNFRACRMYDRITKETWSHIFCI